MTQNVDLRLAPSALKREAKATLVQACTDHGLAVDGTKDQLIARLKEKVTSTTVSPFLHIPPGVLSNPAFNGEDRGKLAQTSRAMRALVMRACTSVIVYPAPANDLQLQEMVRRLRQCCAEGLCLQKLTIDGFDGDTNVTDLGPLAALPSLQHLHCDCTSKVAGLEPLAALTGLRYLDCSYMEQPAILGLQSYG
mmetsp:Transcript_6148/g.16317  ORF Transcript_6148/g.16317 Transcript_6148/m.16317 type:complete len:194 (+) Transcript_6148:281-862(+)